MHPKSVFKVLAAITAYVAAPSYADSMVYKVSSKDNHLYLAGTVHLLKETDYPLPAEFEAAYRDSTVIGYEIDPDIMASPQSQAMLMQRMMLPPGEKLSQKLTPGTYKDFVAVANEQGISAAMLENMNPSAAILIVTVTGLAKLGITPDKGVEMFYNMKAGSDKKKEFSLETMSYQLDMIMSLADGQEDAAVRYTIDSIKTLEKDFQGMVKAWREGDAKGLHKQISGMLKDQYPGMYERLLTKRNKEWLPQLEAKLATPEVETVFVGAGHLVGPDSVLVLLEKAGYTVAPLSLTSTKANAAK